MSNNLFNAELRDCALVNQAVSIEEQHRLAMEAAESRTCTTEELEMYERLIEDEEGYEWEEVGTHAGAELYKAQVEREAEMWEGEPVMYLPNDLFMVFDDPDYWG